MKSPAISLPGVRDSIVALNKAAESCGLPRSTVEFAHVRVGQINGCAVCVDLHCRMLRKLGESDARIFGIAVWREASYYTDAERAALALAEAATRLSDRTDAVPDNVWEEASRHFSENELSGLLVSIAVANLWNRLNVSTRQVSGEYIVQLVEQFTKAS